MALIVEDGTGKADATSYIDLVFADAYFAERGEAKWTGTDTVKEQAIIRAMDYIENRFGSLFLGVKSYPDTQALEFPRDVLGVPLKLKKAVCEYALRALTTPLAADPVTDKTGRALASTRNKVGPIETETSYVTQGAGATPSTFKSYPMADILLKDIVRLNRGVIR